MDLITMTMVLGEDRANEIAKGSKATIEEKIKVANFADYRNRKYNAWVAPFFKGAEFTIDLDEAPAQIAKGPELLLPIDDDE